jgi:hypothetical protein
MPIACSDGETEPAIEIGRCVEIVYGMNDVIEAARHCNPLCCHPAKSDDPVTTSERFTTSTAVTGCPLSRA